MWLQCDHNGDEDRIVRIGNSRGIRIPKTLLDEADLPEEVGSREPGRLVVQSARHPRSGWAQAAKRMRARSDDLLLDEPTSTRFDGEDGSGVSAARLARGQLYLVRLEPPLGSEIRKTRPCVVVSPDELDGHLRKAIGAPMTTGGRAYPWLPRCRFQNRAGFVALDQLRTVDSARLLKPLGRLDAAAVRVVLQRLQAMFAE